MEPFYDTYGELYTDESYDHRLLFNLDETSVNFTDKYRAKVITKETDPPRIVGRPDRTPSCTLVFCIAAIGPALTSCLLWPQANVPKELEELRVHNIYVYANSSGWETKSSFEHIMLHIYIPEMIRRRSQIGAERKKILLLLDGHSSRISLPIILTCIRYNITILVLPAHSSSITQPNDRGVNSVFKSWFAKMAADKVNSVVQLPLTCPPDFSCIDPPPPNPEGEEFPPIPSLARSQQRFDRTTAKSFRELLVSILPISIEHALRLEIVSSAWKICGLHPFNKSIVLSSLPPGNSSETNSSRKALDISGKVLTSFDMEKCIMQWMIEREQVLSTRQLDSRQHIERLEANFKEALRQAEQIQKQIREEEEAHAAIRLETEQNKLMSILLREGRVGSDEIINNQEQQKSTEEKQTDSSYGERATTPDDVDRSQRERAGGISDGEWERGEDRGGGECSNRRGRRGKIGGDSDGIRRRGGGCSGGGRAVRSHAPSEGGGTALTSHPPGVGGGTALTSHPPSVGGGTALTSHPPSAGGGTALTSTPSHLSTRICIHLRRCRKPSSIDQASLDSKAALDFLQSKSLIGEGDSTTNESLESVTNTEQTAERPPIRELIKMFDFILIFY